MNETSVALKEMILKNLGQNGFPMKKVSLPLEKLYEVADNKGANLNHILESLAQEGTAHEKSVDKIIFEAVLPESMANGMNQEDMMKQAQEMMGQMSPEQIAEIQNMVANMSSEEREEMMKKAASMFGGGSHS